MVRAEPPGCGPVGGSGRQPRSGALWGVGRLLAAAQCITDIYTIPLPGGDSPLGTVYNVGGILTASDIVNAVPREVMFTVDLRTVDKRVIGVMDDAMLSKCDQAARVFQVRFTREWIMKFEAGGTAEELADRRKHPIVQTAIDVSKYLVVKMTEGQEAIASGLPMPMREWSTASLRCPWAERTEAISIRSPNGQWRIRRASEPNRSCCWPLRSPNGKRSRARAPRCPGREAESDQPSPGGHGSAGRLIAPGLQGVRTRLWIRENGGLPGY